MTSFMEFMSYLDIIKTYECAMNVSVSHAVSPNVDTRAKLSRVGPEVQAVFEKLLEVIGEKVFCNSGLPEVS